MWLGEEAGTFKDTGLTLTAVRRPKFYDLTTADGIRYEQIARLHGADVLATTVVQTCIRYAESDRCRFCTIEESLRSGATVAAKTPAQLAEVAEAAVRLDGVKQMVMTTGTTTGPDAVPGISHAPSAPFSKRCPDCPSRCSANRPGTSRGYASCTMPGPPPSASMSNPSTTRYGGAGCPASPLSQWPSTRPRDEAVRVFGPNRVSTYLLLGLGEDPDELITGAGELIDRGVYPFVVPFRPMGGTLAVRDGSAAPSASVLRYVTEGVAAKLRAAGMSGADQKAGCAACGACSVLKTAGG